MSSLSQMIIRQLAEVAERTQPQMPSNGILLIHADFDVEGQFARGAGVGAATTALQSAVARDSPEPGIVLVGPLPEAQFRLMTNQTHGVSQMLGWPGFRYLRIPFSAEDLRKAVEAALKGRTNAVPLPTIIEVLTSIASVLHWLERVRQGQAGTARIHADVARGELELPRRSLEPEGCLSPKQRDGLQRLCEKLSLAIGIENNTEMAELLQNDVAALDDASQRLEQLKAGCLSSKSMPDATRLEMLAREASLLAEKATALFDRVRFIEARIIERVKEQHD